MLLIDESEAATALLLLDEGLALRDAEGRAKVSLLVLSTLSSALALPPVVELPSAPPPEADGGAVFQSMLCVQDPRELQRELCMPTSPASDISGGKVFSCGELLAAEYPP